MTLNPSWHGLKVIERNLLLTGHQPKNIRNPVFTHPGCVVAVVPILRRLVVPVYYQPFRWIHTVRQFLLRHKTHPLINTRASCRKPRVNARCRNSVPPCMPITYLPVRCGDRKSTRLNSSHSSTSYAV